MSQNGITSQGASGESTGSRPRLDPKVPDRMEEKGQPQVNKLVSYPQGRSSSLPLHNRDRGLIKMETGASSQQLRQKQGETHRPNLVSYHQLN